MPSPVSHARDLMRLAEERGERPIAWSLGPDVVRDMEACIGGYVRIDPTRHQTLYGLPFDVSAAPGISLRTEPK